VQELTLSPAQPTRLHSSRKGDCPPAAGAAMLRV